MTFVHLDKFKDFDLTSKLLMVLGIMIPHRVNQCLLSHRSLVFITEKFSGLESRVGEEKLKFPEYPLVGDPCFMNWLRFI